MSCGVGYPKLPCPFDHKGPVNRRRCGPCKNYVPPQHILAWCMLWDRDRVLCYRPKTDCEKCPEKFVGLRDNRLIDWKDPVAVRAYHVAQHKANPTPQAEAMVRFLAKHPDYFKNYQKKNPEKNREAVRRQYYKKKAEREKAKANESSPKEVPGDT